MKIGILTYHYVPNFGAQVQALSTVGFIKKMGHVPVLLHWHPYDLETLFRGRVPEIQTQCHRNFADKYFPLTSICRTENDLVREIENNDLDLIITGSDALFKYVPQAKRRIFSKRKLRFVNRKVFCVEDIPDNPFFCDYYDQLSRKIPIYAFSVSSQNCPYLSLTSKEKEMLGCYINNFRTITVRDEWTKGMVEYLTGQENIKITPDPVFAFNQNCSTYIPSKKEIMEKFNLPSKYVLISFWTNKVDSNHIRGIVEELKKEGITLVAFPMPEGLIDFGLENKIGLPLDPMDWYAIIKYSNGYIGERMHPIVVCLHNSVPFYAFDEYGIVQKKIFGLKRKYLQKSSKIYHIVSMAGMTKNLYAYNQKRSKPSCSEIVRALFNFDVAKCDLFAESQQNEYLKAMGTILCE